MKTARKDKFYQRQSIGESAADAPKPRTRKPVAELKPETQKRLAVAEKAVRFAHKANIAAVQTAPARKMTPTAAAVVATSRAYMAADSRKAQLDSSVQKLLKRNGIAALTRTAVAADAGVSNGLLGVYYGNAAGLRIAAVQMAVDAGDLKTARKAVADGFTVTLLTRKAQQALKANAAK